MPNWTKPSPKARLGPLPRWETNKAIKHVSRVKPEVQLGAGDQGGSWVKVLVWPSLPLTTAGAPAPTSARGPRRAERGRDVGPWKGRGWRPAPRLAGPPLWPQSTPGRPGKAGFWPLRPVTPDSGQLAWIFPPPLSSLPTWTWAKLLLLTFFFCNLSVCQTEVANIPMSEGVCCKNIKFIHLTQDPTRRISKYITALIRREDTDTHVKHVGMNAVLKQQEEEAFRQNIMLNLGFIPYLWWSKLLTPFEPLLFTLLVKLP